MDSPSEVAATHGFSMSSPKIPVSARTSGELAAVSPLQEAIAKAGEAGQKLDAINERLDAVKTRIETRSSPGEKTLTIGPWVVVLRGAGPHHNAHDGDADRIVSECVQKLRAAGQSADSADFSAAGTVESLIGTEEKKP